MPDNIKTLYYENLDYTWDNIVAICKSNAFILLDDIEHCLENKKINEVDVLYGKDTISRALGLMEAFRELIDCHPRLSKILADYHNII